MFQKHPVNTKINTAFNSVGPGTLWPIGIDLNNYLDLFTSVKSFDFFLYSQPLSGPVFNVSLDAVALATQGLGSDTIDSATGRSQRQIKLLGELSSTGLEAPTSQYPFTTRNYPFFKLGGPGVSGYIDFGQTRLFGGLFYPKFFLQFSTGPTSSGVGVIVGSINLGNYSVPIYSGTSSSSVVIVSGSIDIAEKYTSLEPSKTTLKIGESLVISRAGDFDFSHIKFAYFGAARAEVVPSASSLRVTIPPDAKSGPIRFETLEPQLDSFTTIFEVTISS